MSKPTELEERWEHEIAKEDARAVADELLAIGTTALEEAQVGIGRVLWDKACERNADRAEDAPLVAAIADVEKRLSRATMYRAIAVFRQSEHLPEETRGHLGPSRLYSLLRLPNDHIEKKALARRAALSAMPLDELDVEIDQILGVRRRHGKRGLAFGTQVGNLAKAAKVLRKRAATFTPRDQRDLDKKKREVAAVLAELTAVAAELDRIVVPRE